MACINMYNSDVPPLAGPRISFSSDFAVEPPAPATQRAMPGDQDFEFSVGSHHMLAADQLFSKGRILPLKESAAVTAAKQQTKAPLSATLREELRADQADGERTATRGWRDLLGLRRGHHCATVKKGDFAGKADGDAVMIDVPPPSPPQQEELNETSSFSLYHQLQEGGGQE